MIASAEVQPVEDDRAERQPGDYPNTETHPAQSCQAKAGSTISAEQTTGYGGQEIARAERVGIQGGGNPLARVPPTKQHRRDEEHQEQYSCCTEGVRLEADCEQHTGNREQREERADYRVCQVSQD